MGRVSTHSHRSGWELGAGIASSVTRLAVTDSDVVVRLFVCLEGEFECNSFENARELMEVSKK